MFFVSYVDDATSAPRLEITPEMKAFMQTVRQRAVVGIVGGSDVAKQAEQLGETCE